MKSNTFTTIIITPENGYYLTQNNEVELKDRIVCSQVALGSNDSADNWKEITIEEGEEIKAQQEALRAEENK